MKYNPEKHHRKSIRLQGFDYSMPGAYFITICVKNRECLFGKINNGKMKLNKYGKITQQCWLDIPNHFPHAKLDEFIVMPNHIHGIIILDNIVVVGANNYSPLQQQTHQNLSPTQTHQNFLSANQPMHNNLNQCGTSKTIGSIVRGFKIGVTKWFRQNTEIYTVWQRNYYEHIIRHDDELNRIRKYIIENPMNWEMDQNYT